MVEIIQQICKNAVEQEKPVHIWFGIVQTVHPLTVYVDQNITLKERELVLSRNVTDFQTEISFDNPAIKQIFTTWDMGEEVESPPEKISFKDPIHHEITVYHALKPGEGVILMRIQGGQRFLILDRIGVVE